MSEIELNPIPPLSGNGDLKHDGTETFQTIEPSIVEANIVPRSRFRLIAILTALFLSLFIAALDQTIIATSVPTVSAELHSASGYTWIGGAYTLANAAGAPIWAKLSDIWGRKPILLAAVAMFFSASIICAQAVSMRMLIAGRALQGTAAGGLIQLVHITISDLYSMRSRSLYLGLLEVMWALAGGIGPILGGTFTELASWRWNFYINLPICGLAFILLFFYLDVHNPRTNAMDGIKAIDWLGSLSILGLTLMLLLGLDFGGTVFPWSSPRVIVLMVVGCLMSLVFVLCEKRFAKYPVMPMQLFKNSSNIASLLVGAAHGFVFIAGEYYLPLYFQSVKEAKPIQSGLYILPLTVTEALAGLVTGFLIHRTGRYVEFMWIGMAFLTLGNGLFIYLGAQSSLGLVIGFEIINGIGAGLVFQPPLLAIQALAAQDDVASATATLGFVRDLSISTSIVVGGVVLQNSMDLRTPLLKAVGLPASIVAEFTGKDAVANVNRISTISDPAQRLVVKEAFAWSMRNMWILMTGVSACGVVAAIFVGKASLSKEHTETRTGIKEKEETSR